MQSSTRVLLGQAGDNEANQAFSSGGWFMFRSSPFHPGSFGTLLSKMESTEHDRGWELSSDDDGILSVALVNQRGKDTQPERKDAKKRREKKEAATKEPFNYPTPQDLSKKDLAPNKPAEQKKAEEEEAKKAKAKTEAEAKAKKTGSGQPAKGNTPELALRVVVVKPIPLDGAWKHIFFTYDGSGRASGVKIYINGAPVATRVLKDNLAGTTIRTQLRCNSGGAIPMSTQPKMPGIRTSDFMHEL